MSVRRHPPSGPQGPLRWVAHRALASGRIPTLPDVRERLRPRPGGPVAVRLGVFAVEDTTVQLAWGALGPGPVQVRAGDTRVEVVADGGPGAVTLQGLPPDTTLSVELRGEGVPDGVARLPVRTLRPPPGEELHRIATMSDLHVGGTTFGYLHTIADQDLDDPHPVRCTRAAIREAVAWGAQRIVIKGDVVDQSHPGAWTQAAELLASAPVPVDVLPGNHETKRRRTIDPEVALRPYGLELVRGVRVHDLPGVRLVLVDSTRMDVDWGRLAHVADDLVKVVGDAAGGALVLLHHHPARSPVPLGWPLGIPQAEARTVLHEVAAANPATFVSTGHVHRNRRWQHGPMPLTSVGSVKDYPGVWAGYAVHEGGIRQVVRRVEAPEAPEAIHWTERTGDALLGGYRLWTPGRLSDRSFSWPWPSKA